MDKVGADILVSGRVQGVNYRFFAKSIARELGLTGYCENLIDGRVLVRTEGARAAIQEFIKQLKIGPPSARVKDIQSSWRPLEGEHDDFSIHF